MDHLVRAAELSALRPRLLRRARRYVGDGAAAEDLVQEALMRVWVRMRQEPPIAELDAYLFTAMKRLAGRRRPREDALETCDEPSCAAEAPGRIVASEVLEALRELPRDQKELLLGHAVEGDSYATLAERFGVPVGTVMSRIARGRARLKERFDLPEDAPVEALLDLAG